jgi:hypothetical protein
LIIAELKYINLPYFWSFLLLYIINIFIIKNNYLIIAELNIYIHALFKNNYLIIAELKYINLLYFWSFFIIVQYKYIHY